MDDAAQRGWEGRCSLSVSKGKGKGKGSVGTLAPQPGWLALAPVQAFFPWSATSPCSPHNSLLPCRPTAGQRNTGSGGAECRWCITAALTYLTYLLLPDLALLT